MTFQVALVGADGLVVASDRKVIRMSYVPDSNPIMQEGEQDKFVTSENGSVACFYAGGPSSQTIATTVALHCTQSAPSELRWETAVRTRINQTQQVQTPMSDQILIIRKCDPQGVWLALKHPQLPSAAVNKVIDHVFTGHNADARFLISRLWRKSASVGELKSLALLALAYATAENPTAIGPPYDVLTLTYGQEFDWSRYEALDNLRDEFDAKLRAAFEGISPVTALNC